MRHLLGIAGLLLGALVCPAHGQSVDAGHVARMQEGMALFKASVRDILKSHCIECHGEDEIEGEFDMSTRDSLFASGLVGSSADESDLVDAIRDHIGAGRPFLGICLGLHLLFDVSYEDGEYEGLGIIPGQVVRFESRAGLRIPHMGWNALQIEQANPLLHGLYDGDHVYFVHSYHVVPQEDAVVATRTDHGGPFVSMIARDNLFATQFHPEKSQRIGLKLLENFANLPV